MDSYKYDKSLADKQIHDKLTSDKCELDQQIMDIRDTICGSFLENNQEKYYESIIALNQFFENYPNCSIKIIQNIWIPEIGNYLLETLCNLPEIHETNSFKYISNNFLLISNLLKDQNVKNFYSDSPLIEETVKILSNSDNHIDIIEQSIHVLIKCIEYAEPESVFRDILPIINVIYTQSPLCERYSTRLLKKIIFFVGLPPIMIKKICDIFYFILVKPLSEQSIKHLMMSLQFIVRCDVMNNLNKIIESKIINQFITLLYLKYKKKIFRTSPCFLIPFLEFISTIVYYCDYRSVAKIFKIIPIHFFQKMYSNKSDPQIQSLILYIFGLRLFKSFCLNDEDKAKEFESILTLFDTILKHFEEIDFNSKNELVSLIGSLLDTNYEATCRTLTSNSDFFFQQLSYFIFDLHNDKMLSKYIQYLTTVLDNAIKEGSQDAFIECFKEELYCQFDDIINSDELEEDTFKKASQLMEQVKNCIEQMEEESLDENQN